jgi:hypothetical protein
MCRLQIDLFLESKHTCAFNFNDAILFPGIDPLAGCCSRFAGNVMKSRYFSNDDQQLLEQVMLHRRDVRGNNFLRDDVPDEIVDKILHSASLAPSVGYPQPWEFVVIRDAAVKQKISVSFDLENKKAAALFVDEKKEMYARLKLEAFMNPR